MIKINLSDTNTIVFSMYLKNIKPKRPVRRQSRCPHHPSPSNDRPTARSFYTEPRVRRRPSYCWSPQNAPRSLRQPRFAAWSCRDRTGDAGPLPTLFRQRGQFDAQRPVLPSRASVVRAVPSLQTIQYIPSSRPSSRRWSNTVSVGVGERIASGVPPSPGGPPRPSQPKPSSGSRIRSRSGRTETEPGRSKAIGSRPKLAQGHRRSRAGREIEEQCSTFAVEELGWF